MDYYARRRAVSRELHQIIFDQGNMKTTWTIAYFEIEFNRKYGLGRNVILKILEPYEKKKYIEIGKDSILILGLGKNTPATQPTATNAGVTPATGTAT